MTTASTPRHLAEGSPNDLSSRPAARQPSVKQPATHMAWRVLRAVIGLAAAIAAFASAAVPLLAGVIITTGCFIACTEADPLAGIPLLLLAVALAALGLAALWWGFVNRHWRKVWMVLGVFSAVATVAVLSVVGSVH